MSQAKRDRINRRKKRERFGVGIFIILVAFALIYLIFASILVSPKTTLEVGQIAPDTIEAPREIEDTYSTDIAIQEARLAVDTKYSRVDEISQQVMTGLAEAFTAIDIVMALGQEEYERMRNSGEEIKWTSEFYEICLDELPDVFVTGDVVNIIQIEDQESYIGLKEELTALMQKEMDSGIIADSESDSLKASKEDLKTRLLLSGYNDEVLELGRTLIDIYLLSNMIYDVDGTDDARDKAALEVEPIIYKEGDVIVYEGDELNVAQIQMLKTLGLIEDSKDGWIEYIAIGVIVLVLCTLIIFYLMSFNKDIAYINKNLSLAMVVLIAGLMIMWILKQVQVNAYFIPTAYVPLMIYLLLGDKRAAIYINALLALLIGFMYIRTGEGILLPMVLGALVSGTVSVFAVMNAAQRSSIFYAGFISGLVMGLVYAAFDLLNHVEYLEILENMGWGVMSGVFVAILAVGTLPLFEATYKIVTPMKLMELTNPNQPLLKKLLLEAPGTYHHSIMVGNLAERAADAVGANALLVRTAAYYHDVGKIKRPYFFVENHSDNRNPHDNIDSRASVDVITSHLSDGMDMLRRANIPPIVQEIAGQHHGDTAVMYFYRKDLEESNYPENIKIENYRYEGERPKTKEAGILMMADSCEAAVRSLEDDATREVVKERIDAVVKGKLDDGQLDYCDLTLNEISKVKDAFLVALTGLFHERIEYPDAKKQEEE